MFKGFIFRKRTLGFGSCVLVLALCLLRFGEIMPISKPRCVLSPDQVAFCYKICCVLSPDQVAFCYKICCVLSPDQVASCFKIRCVLLQVKLRFASRQLAFCLKIELRFRSRFLRYVDTRLNGEALRKCILSGPYKPTTVLVQAVAATDDSSAIPEHTTVETPMNISPANKVHFEAEKEAIHLILTGIGDEIYSTVDACQTAHEMWEAIKRLQQGESLNIQDAKTNLFWEFGIFTSHDRETMESYYTRFYKLMNEMIINNLTVATMQVNV
nr:hypothetical protein [Tanacetum cinerariifolium]